MASSLHHTILEQVQTEIRSLNLTGIESANVVIQAVPDDQPSSWGGTPGISVTPVGQETLSPGTNQADDIGYPVSIFTVAAANNDQTTNVEQWLEWREQLFDHFSQTRLGSLSGVVQLITKSGFSTIIDPAAWQARGLMVSQLTLEVGVRKQRRA